MVDFNYLLGVTDKSVVGFRYEENTPCPITLETCLI